jgi:hypothetical protein
VNALEAGATQHFAWTRDRLVITFRIFFIQVAADSLKDWAQLSHIGFFL